MADSLLKGVSSELLRWEVKGVLLLKKKKILLQDKSALTDELGPHKAQRPDGAAKGRDVQRRLGDEPQLPCSAQRGAGRAGSALCAPGLPCLGWGIP